MSTAAFDLKALSDQVRDQLLGDPFFASIPAEAGDAVVISDDPHDIVTAINAALNNIGLGVLVLLPVAHVKCPNLPGPYFDEINVTVKIYESPTVNRAVTTNGGNNPTCYAAAVQICALLHQWAPAGVDECFYVQECVPVADDDFIIYQVTVTTAAGVIYRQPQLAPVTADSTAPGNVTLSCATAGAAIWFTLDGSYPSPRSPGSRLVQVQTNGFLLDENGAVQYSESGQPLMAEQGASATNLPLSVQAGQRLRARAWLDGYAPSNPPELNLQY